MQPVRLKTEDEELKNFLNGIGLRSRPNYAVELYGHQENTGAKPNRHYII